MRTALPAIVRPALGRPPRLDNPGLALDRYLSQADDARAKHDLFQQIAEAAPSSPYGLRYKRWCETLQQLPHTRLGVFEARGRLIVGLGNESVHEVGVVLQHVDGTPYLPGSGLKGLASHYLAQRAVAADASAQPRDIVFGTTSDAGYVTFFDAWYVPETAPDDRPLALDTITVHHPDYYTGRPRREPWDLDAPTPIPFLSVRGRFLVAVRGWDRGWADFAFALLRRALEDWGAGAKTSSGYGRLEWVQDIEAAESSEATTPAQQATADHPLVQTLRATPAARLRQSLGGIVQQAERLDEPQRAAVLTAIAAVVRGDRALWRWAQDRAWFKTVAEYAAADDAEGNA